METLRTIAIIACAMPVMSGLAHAGDYDWEDIFGPYRHRIDTVTPSAGNDHNVNTVTQMITPWPPYVHDRYIPGDGARMAGAIERYHNPAESGETGAQSQSPLGLTLGLSSAGQSGQSGTSGQ
jgi:hypothetical protein